MSTRQKALDALADIEHQASGGLEIDSALFRTVRAALSAPTADGWIPVAERMPDSGCVVLACYRNSAGNLRRIRAEWVAAKTQESDSDISEYDEATDTYYDPQGWYERIDNWDDGFSAVGVSQGEVTHWMHLPDAPGAAAPRYESPSAVYRPSLSVDGNQWCALYGDNLQDGVAGFGDSPADAMWDFDRNWSAKLATKGEQT